MLLTTPIQRVPVHICGRVCVPFFRVPLRANAILHARTGRIEKAAGTVDHVAFDQLVQMRLGGRVGQFSRDEAVDLGWRAGLIGFDQDEEKVDVREASFLEFYDISPRKSLFKYVLNCQGSEEHLKLCVEHPRNEVRPVLRLLARTQVCSYLGPFRVCRASDEEVGSPKASDEAHSVEV